MRIVNYIWGYDWEIYVSLLSPDFPEETCQRLNISSAPQPSINRKKWKGATKWKKGWWPFLNSLLPTFSHEHRAWWKKRKRVPKKCVQDKKTNRGWEFRLEAYLSDLYLFFSDLAIREAIKYMLSISDKWSKLQTDPAAATILLFLNWAILSSVIEAIEGSHLVATQWNGQTWFHAHGQRAKIWALRAEVAGPACHNYSLSLTHSIRWHQRW